MPERNVNLSCAPPVALLHYRSLFPFALNELNLMGTGCEVGVQDGHFSVTLLKRWRGSLLYSIDPWREFEPSKYLDVANQQQAVQDRIYEGARNRLRKFGERSVIIRSTSAAGATQFAEGQLDFVYIDANHSYDAVVEDIRLWYPKLKPGGVLAGHDYLDGNYTAGVFGVMSAVNEFAAGAGLQVYAAGTGLESPSWIVQKHLRPLASGCSRQHDDRARAGLGASAINRIEDILPTIRDKQGSELLRQRIRSLVTDPGKVMRFCMMRLRRGR